MPYQTPKDVLERTYRRALEQADALSDALSPRWNCALTPKTNMG